MAVTTNVVNLDALIKRADLAEPGDISEEIPSLSILGLERGGLLYPALRKPDFQRETASWAPEQVADLISTFARRELIPALILWRAGSGVFVIDGAHRLSALIAWAQDDYGDGDVSRRFFQNVIPDEQRQAAQRTRDLVKLQVGSYQDHKMAVDYPNAASPELAQRAARIPWHPIQVQWIQNADHDKAEKAFFRINQGGTKIDPTEQRILNARRSATALAARAVLRGGTGHHYWSRFNEATQGKIEELGKECFDLLFTPSLSLPIKTLDIPVAGQGYGPHILPFVFDLVNLVNRVAAADSSRKRGVRDELEADEDGSKTIEFLKGVRAALWRVCSTNPSSLGLHPALYFYTPTGVFQPTALLNFVALFREWNTKDFLAFTSVRAEFEEFLLSNRGITEAVRKLGSGIRSRPRVLGLYKRLIADLQAGKSVKQVEEELARDPDYGFLVEAPQELRLDVGAGRFSRDTKGGAFLRDALPSAPRCPTCGGIMHRNGMQAGHILARREGGPASLSNAQMQHPFCNSTVEN
jgi:hypothetical protein